MQKPPFRIPTMAEITALPWNGLKVASTFSGCGGSCLGYRMAGYRVLFANEFVPAAQEAYKANHPNSYLFTGDVRRLAPELILEKCGVAKGELDVFDGSPPCSAFSRSGKGSAKWGQVKNYSDVDQRCDDLFFEYVRLLHGVMPKVFVAENVPALKQGDAAGLYLQMIGAMRDCGYVVKGFVLDASGLGVPQARKRLIFVGVREDLGKMPTPPPYLSYAYSAREAVEGLPELTAGERDRLSASETMNKLWHNTKPGMSFMAACQQLMGKPNCFNSRRLHGGKPSPTVMATAGLYHWDECRQLGVPELKRLSGFPDDFVLTGAFAKQVERIGRAVPPMMMAAISGHIARTIFDRS
jgi:DNA (cytosine-5)-methyltransferase 1